MAFNLNKVYLSGNIGSPPRVFTGKSGAEFCSFSIAVNPRRFNQQTNQWEQQPTEWFNVTVFNRPQVEICKALPKGATVLVEGSLRANNYVDKATNTERTSINVVADSIFVVDRSVGRTANGNFGNPGNFANQNFGGYGDYNQGYGNDFNANQGSFGNGNFGNNQNFTNNNSFGNNGFNNNSFSQPAAQPTNSFSANSDFGSGFSTAGDNSFNTNSFNAAPATNGAGNDFATGGFSSIPNNEMNRNPKTTAPVAEENKPKPTIEVDDLPF